MAFVDCPCLSIASFHHSFMFHIACQFVGSTSWRPSWFFTFKHTWIVNLHLKISWAADSCTWLQSLHLWQFDHPLFWSQSDFHTLFWVINHGKILHLGGANGFQTKEGMQDLGCPKKCMVWADFEDWQPSLVSFQRIESYVLGSNCIPWVIPQRLTNCTMWSSHRPSWALTCVIQNSLSKALLTVHFLLFNPLYMRGVMSLVRLPFSQGASQRIAFFPSSMMTFVAAAKWYFSRVVQGVPRPTQGFVSSFHSCHNHLIQGPKKILWGWESQVLHNL
jgi:hypothetical protein